MRAVLLLEKRHFREFGAGLGMDHRWQKNIPFLVPRL